MSLEVLFTITDEMRACKTRFWKAMETNPLCDPEHITVTAAVQMTGEKKLNSWWNKPNFEKWFTAGDEYELKLTSAKFDAVDALHQIASDIKAPASARVAAAKHILDHAGKSTKEDDSLEKLLKQIAGTSSLEELKKFKK